MNEEQQDAITRMEEIKDEMKELLDEAQDIVKDFFNRGTSYERAKAYWIAHIRVDLDKDNEYLSGSMCNMEDTINEMRGGDDE